MLNEVVNVAVIEQDISDHHPLTIKFKFKPNRKEERRPMVRKITTKKNRKFCGRLNQ